MLSLKRYMILYHTKYRLFLSFFFVILVSIRSPPLPPGAFNWITASFKVKDTELLEKVGLDAYMFLRFLRMSA